MTKTHQLIFNRSLQGLGGFMIALTPILWILLQTFTDSIPVSTQHFFWVHSALMLFSVVVCACIFIVGWHVLDESRPKASVLLACAFLAVGLFDTAHMLSYQGMPDFLTTNTSEKALAFRLIAGLIAAIALLVFVMPRPDMQPPKPVLSKALYLAVTLTGALGLSLLFIFSPAVLQPLSNTSLMSGLLDMLVIVVHIITLYWLLKGKSAIDAPNRSGLALAVGLMVASQSLFLLSVEAMDPASFLAHVYKAISYVFLYRSIFLNNISLPVVRLRDANQSLQYYASQMDELLRNAPDGIVGVDTSGKITFLNARTEDMFGYSQQELVGEKIEMLLPISMRDRHSHLRSEYLRTPTGRPMSTTRGLVGRRKDGREVPLDIALGFHQGIHGGQITAFIRDVTERQKLEAEMLHRANHDLLTGLPNRALLRERLERALVQARRQQSGFALIMIDLDNFKDINDGWGHSLGDQLLVTVARRLAGVLREGDTVARFGGDEFVVLAENMADPEATRAIVDKILSVLSHVFMLGQTEFVVSASLGVANYPLHGNDTETLLSMADIAMYKAKGAGRRTACFYDETMGLHQQQQTQLKSWLIGALEKQELMVFYQPQYDVANQDIIGFEALLRWDHPEVGWISPDKFIPVAEANGMIIPVTEWILRQVCAQINIWQDMGYHNRVSVNISAVHFRREGVLCQLIENLLDCSGINPQLLGLELTETALMDNPAIVADTLRRMVGLGLHISIDDFGTGYSSLASLQLYPLHTLKVDRSFMGGLARDNKSAAIVKGLVNLAASLGLEVLAEGVETEDQLDFLRSCGCDSIQGWLMNPAMSSFACTQLLAETGSTQRVMKSLVV
ncbi:MAG: EAL domain-containing protein [Pseudohongiella sp.]|nr:EAL domain-containing protein [Pseudohongiella sp.]